MQGFAYTTLIVLAERPSATETDAGGETSYLVPAVTGAMYLLVASTTHDLRGGFSLVVDGSCAGHRTFGIGLLTVYGIMVCAAMKVLVSTSNDSASVVLNSVTVLFIADLVREARHNPLRVIRDHNGNRFKLTHDVSLYMSTDSLSIVVPWYVIFPVIKTNVHLECTNPRNIALASTS